MNSPDPSLQLRSLLSDSPLLLTPELIENGLASSPKIRRKLLEIEKSAQENHVPEWVLEEGRKTAARLHAWREADDTIVFPIITDVHCGERNTYRQIIYLNSLAALFPFDFIADLGDIGPDEPSSENPLVSRMIHRRHAWLHRQFPGTVLQLVGNHDHNRRGGGRADWITNREIGELHNRPMLKRTENLTVGPDCTYGFYDLPEHRTRIIFLNSSDFENIPDSYYAFDETQLKFLADALQFTEPGWTAAVLSHLCIHPIGAWIQYGNDSVNGDVVCRILEDFNRGTCGELRGLSWNFTGNRDCRLSAVLCGDSHFDADVKHNGVNIAISQGYGGINDANLPQHASFLPPDNFSYDREMLIDVVALKPKQRNMRLFRIGNGGPQADRSFSW